LKLMAQYTDSRAYLWIHGNDEVSDVVLHVRLSVSDDAESSGMAEKEGWASRPFDVGLTGEKIRGYVCQIPEVREDWPATFRGVHWLRKEVA
jgi:hypothetical protein